MTTDSMTPAKTSTGRDASKEANGGVISARAQRVCDRVMSGAYDWIIFPRRSRS